MIHRPHPLPRSLRLRTNLVHIPLMAAATIGCGSTALFFSLLEKSGRRQHRIAQAWARLLVRISGSPLKVVGAENLCKYPVAVFASNHTSYMDTPVVFAALKFQFRILARKPLWKVPFIGWYLNRSGQLPIDTDNPHSTLSSLGNAVKALRAHMPVFVFPEGGRTENGDLKPFLSGAAFLAIRAQVPIVPIALAGVYELLPIHTRHLYPTQLTLIAGAPISTKGLTLRQVNEVTDRLKQAIQSMKDSGEPTMADLVLEASPIPEPE
jgi:1-acyl-sn-glycerol-3-phosphate acyltransferase